MKKAWITVVLAILIILIMSYPATAKESDIQVKVNSFSEWGEVVQNTLEFGNKEKPRIELEKYSYR